jgi:hypothetical protein
MEELFPHGGAISTWRSYFHMEELFPYGEAIPHGEATHNCILLEVAR